MAGAKLAAREVTNDPIALSATVPLTAQQRQLAIAVVAVLLVAFGITATWRAAPMPQLDAFIPCIETTIFVTDLITAALLFSQFSIIRSRALLVLASGYLFTALIVVPHMLTFPGAFSPTGLLGAGLQSTGWLYVSWHFGFPVALGVYAWLRDKESANSMQVSTRLAIGCSVAITVCVVCGLTLLATTGEELLPRLFLDRTHVAPLERDILGLNLLVITFVLALLWTRRRSLLDQWLLVVACAWTLELAMTGLLSPTRFSLGWYAGRTFSVITATVVLIVILSEMTKLYARLARSNAALQREQNNRLMNLEAMAASIHMR